MRTARCQGESARMGSLGSSYSEPWGVEKQGIGVSRAGTCRKAANTASPPGRPKASSTLANAVLR